MSLEIKISESKRKNLSPKILILGIGGAGNNAISNLIRDNIENVDFLALNTDAQTLSHCLAKDKIQLGVECTQGLGAGAKPDVGKLAAEESLEEIKLKITNYHMIFIAAGMGGGTGTGAAPVVAKIAKELGILSIGVVTKPFDFEGSKRRDVAKEGIKQLKDHLDTLIIIPNQHLFRLSNNQTSLADAFRMADNVLCSGVRSITDLIMRPGLKNLDFNDVRTVMQSQGKALIGTGEASGDNRAKIAAEMAISNPLLEEIDIKEAGKVLINITSGLTLSPYELDEATNFIRERIASDAEVHWGAGMDEALQDELRVAVIITGIDKSNESISQGLEENSLSYTQKTFLSNSRDTLITAQKKYFARKMDSFNVNENESKAGASQKNLYHNLTKEEIEQLELVEASENNQSDKDPLSLSTNPSNSENTKFVNSNSGSEQLVNNDFKSSYSKDLADKSNDFSSLDKDGFEVHDLTKSKQEDKDLSQETNLFDANVTNQKIKTNSEDKNPKPNIKQASQINFDNNKDIKSVTVGNSNGVSIDTYSEKTEIKSKGNLMPDDQSAPYLQESFDFNNQPPTIDQDLLSSQNQSFFLDEQSNSSTDTDSTENRELTIADSSINQKEKDQRGFFKRIANKLFHGDSLEEKQTNKQSLSVENAEKDLEKNMVGLYDEGFYASSGVDVSNESKATDDLNKIPAFLRKQANSIS